MSRAERHPDSKFDIQRLEKRHQALKAEVASFESRRVLTSSEQVTLQRLKKEKLATKDAIARASMV